MEAQRRCYTVPQAAEVLGIGKSACYEYAKCGELPSIRVGGRVLIPIAALDRLLEGNGAFAFREQGG